MDFTLGMGFMKQLSMKGGSWKALRSAPAVGTLKPYGDTPAHRAGRENRPGGGEPRSAPRRPSHRCHSQTAGESAAPDALQRLPAGEWMRRRLLVLRIDLQPRTSTLSCAALLRFFLFTPATSGDLVGVSYTLGFHNTVFVICRPLHISAVLIITTLCFYVDV